VLEHHTRNENKADFDNFRTSREHRVALLVDRGVEGWDVPALFACALARRLQSSNNFVLQAACRCLRQVPGNRRKARIYLSQENFGILDRQLREAYGERIDELNRAQSRSGSDVIRLRKLEIPPLVVRQVVRTVLPGDRAEGPLRLTLPQVADVGLQRRSFDIAQQHAARTVLQQVGETVEITAPPETIDVYAAAADLARLYREEVWPFYDELRRLYPEGEVPLSHLPALAGQVEAQRSSYRVQEEVVERALALVKTEGFREAQAEDGTTVYTAEISYPLDRERLLARWEEWKDVAGPFGFHYTPYNFDSQPEQHFFEQILRELKVHPGDVEDIYFTGALTSRDKTDFLVEYIGEDGRWHTYTPDFIIRRKDGCCLIVEIKDARFENVTLEDLERSDRGEPLLSVEGRKAAALRAWERLDPHSLRYQILFAKAETLAHDQLEPARHFVR
jgi:type III restriction enzyme